MDRLSENPRGVEFGILCRLKRHCPAKAAVAIAMGRNGEERAGLAKLAGDAGCGVAELNFPCPQMRTEGMGCDVGQPPVLVGASRPA